MSPDTYFLFSSGCHFIPFAKTLGGIHCIYAIQSHSSLLKYIEINQKSKLTPPPQSIETYLYCVTVNPGRRERVLRIWDAEKAFRDNFDALLKLYRFSKKSPLKFLKIDIYFYFNSLLMRRVEGPTYVSLLLDISYHAVSLFCPVFNLLLPDSLWKTASRSCCSRHTVASSFLFYKLVSNFPVTVNHVRLNHGRPPHGRWCWFICTKDPRLSYR